LPHVGVEIVKTALRPMPQVRVQLDEAALGLSAFDLVNRLADGDPPILVAQGAAREGAIGLSPVTLRAGHAGVLVEAPDQHPGAGWGAGCSAGVSQPIWPARAPGC